MAKRSLTDVREAETKDKADSLQRIAKELGQPISREQAEKAADKRVRDAMERNLRDGKV
jgi:hypothetical protein